MRLSITVKLNRRNGKRPPRRVTWMMCKTAMLNTALTANFRLDCQYDHGNMTMSYSESTKPSGEENTMEKMISKSHFKPRALEYFREVEKTGQEIIISDRGKPVLKIVPYTEKPEQALKALRNTVVKYVDPTEPVGLEDWEALK